MTELTRTIARFIDLKRLHRENAWSAVLDKYTEITNDLLAIRTRNRNLTIPQKQKIQEVVVQMRDLERIIENALQSNQNLDSARLNQVVNEPMEHLAEIEGELESEQDA